MKLIETGNHPNAWPIPQLSPRIIVFRAFVDQLPKLDVAGSTPVARSRASVASGGSSPDACWFKSTPNLRDWTSETSHRRSAVIPRNGRGSSQLREHSVGVSNVGGVEPFAERGHDRREVVAAGAAGRDRRSRPKRKLRQARGRAQFPPASTVSARELAGLALELERRGRDRAGIRERRRLSTATIAMDRALEAG